MNIEITNDGMKGQNTVVKLDGNDISNCVCSATLKCEVGCINRVELDILPQKIEVETEGHAYFMHDGKKYILMAIEEVERYIEGVEMSIEEERGES